MSNAKRNLDQLIFNNPKKVEISRKILIKKSGRELFKPFKGKIVKITESVKKGQKRPVVSPSSSTSPEDNTPLRPTSTRTRIAA